MNKFISSLSGNEFPLSERIPGTSVRKSVMQLIQQDNPEFDKNGFLSASELNLYRQKYIELYMTRELGSLTDLEMKVLESLKDKSTLTDKLDADNQILSLGQRVADRVADFGGSWTFIISFMVFLALWILLNVFWLANRGFDPYPFILLNLILSTLAAIQAPVIMMSQNRQEEKDRERARKDYMVNLKAEMEIKVLHEKLDHLIMSRDEDVMEVHKIQTEMMQNILQRINKLINSETNNQLPE